MKLIYSIFFLSLFLLTACSGEKDVVWNDLSKNEIVGTDKGATDRLHVDIYVDATTSMSGFTAAGATNYAKLLENIESVVKTVWKESAINYWKFGTNVDSIPRTQFVSAKSDPKFYADLRTGGQVNIDKAVVFTNPQRVSVIITDLFYQGQDINEVVGSINESCTKKGVEIGVLSVSSFFDGIVADVNPLVRVKEERPLYVLVFGDKSNIQQLLGVLKNQAFVKPEHQLLITKHPVADYGVSVEKEKASRGVNSDKGDVKKYEGFGTVFGFKLKNPDEEAVLDVEIQATFNNAVTKPKAGNLKAVVFKKLPGEQDSVLTDEVKMDGLLVDENKITGKLRINTNEKSTKISYLVYLQMDNTVPLEMPKWVQDYDTDVYTKRSPKDKTIYLNSLFSQVSTYNITFNNPKIAKFFINLRQ